MFLWPPRPEALITPVQIEKYLNRGWIAQKKIDGYCVVVSIDNSRNVEFKTRHNTLFSKGKWVPTKEAIVYFSHFKDSVFVGELLHKKTWGVTDTIYLFDVLRHMGRDLVGTTLSDRQKLLRSVIPLSDKIRIIENHTQNLTGLFKSLSERWEEGLVLKDPNAKLETCLRKGMNSNWQVKIRRRWF